MRLLLLVAALAAAPLSAADPATGANFPLANKFTRDFVYQHVQEANVFPQFIGKTDVFWYSVRTPNGSKYYRVDPARKVKEPLFDAGKLSAQLSESLQKPIDTDTLALSRVTVTDDGLKMRFVVGETQFEYEFTGEKLTKVGRAAPEPRAFPKGDSDERTRELKERFREEQERMEKENDRKDDERKEKIEDKKVEGKKEDATKKEGEKKEEGKTEEKKGEGRKGGFTRGGFDYKAYSPDRKRYVYAQKHNLYLAEEGKESEAVQLTTDGEEDYSFSGFGGRGRGGNTNTSTTEEKKIPPATDRKTRPNVTWSPDSKSFFVTRTDGRGVNSLFLVNPLTEPRPSLETYKYPMPGEDAVFKSELFYCVAADKKMVKVKPKWMHERYSNIHWNKTGDELRVIRRDRLQRHLEICAVDTKAGSDKCLIADGFDAAFLDFQDLRYVDESDEMIWWSERSGWGHFYLYGRDGKLKNPITSGGWRASRIVDVDAKNRLLYFVGNGREKGENIYYTHLYRVRFDGTDLTCLDPSPMPTSESTHKYMDDCGGMNHTSYLSPSKRFVVTSASRIDAPMISYVLDEKGSIVMDLEKTDTRALEKTGWKLPETFCVKAADGVTTLYGNMWKPFDFDPKKQYPIIAHVYPGPQTEGVTHRFTAYSTNMQLAQLGFIVVQVGHRGGTPERSKAYHSYGYFNLRDYALADKKSAIEQLAARHPFIDVTRVGIYGHSGGGFLSAAALLQKPFNDFFKVAVASAGNHDNNIYNDNWSERYHGLKEVPIDPKEAPKKENTIPPTKPGFDEEEADDEPQDKKADEKKAEAKKDEVKKVEAKKEEAKKEEVKKSEAKKEEVKKTDDKKAEVKKVEETKSEAKKDEKKAEEKKVEEAKKSETPKTRFEIKVPTNAELAANLKGHLLLVHGDMDNNVHPANTMRLVDALIKANKRFDMIILPGKRHGFADMQGYFTQRMWDHFAEHLLDDRQTAPDLQDRVPRR